MKVGVLTKSLPMQLECIDKEQGVFNLYVPGSLNINAIKAIMKNPPEDCNYITIYDAEGKDRWKHMIERMGKELDIKWYRFEKKDGFVHYVVDLKNQLKELE